MSWLTDLIFGRSEEDKAAARWRRHNAAAKAAGCKCGRPATHVRYGYGTIGGVPAEIWSCEEHTNVNGWYSTDGVHFEPSPGATFDGMEKWVSPSYPPSSSPTSPRP